MHSSAQFKVVYVDPYDGADHDMSVEQSYWEELDLELVRIDPPCQTEDEIIAAAHDADVVLFTGQYTPFNEKTYAGLSPMPPGPALRHWHGQRGCGGGYPA